MAIGPVRHIPAQRGWYPIMTGNATTKDIGKAIGGDLLMIIVGIGIATAIIATTATIIATTTVAKRRYSSITVTMTAGASISGGQSGRRDTVQ